MCIVAHYREYGDNHLLFGLPKSSAASRIVWRRPRIFFLSPTQIMRPSSGISSPCVIARPAPRRRSDSSIARCGRRPAKQRRSPGGIGFLSHAAAAVYKGKEGHLALAPMAALRGICAHFALVAAATHRINAAWPARVGARRPRRRIRSLARRRCRGEGLLL